MVFGMDFLGLFKDEFWNTWSFEMEMFATVVKSCPILKKSVTDISNFGRWILLESLKIIESQNSLEVIFNRWQYEY